MSYIRRDGWYVYGDGERVQIWTHRRDGNATKQARDAGFEGGAGVAMPEELFGEMCSNWLSKQVPPVLEPAAKSWFDELLEIRGRLFDTTAFNEEARLSVFVLDRLLVTLNPEYRAELNVYLAS